MGIASGPRSILGVSDLRSLVRRSNAEACRRSLAEFVRQGWSVVEPGTPLVWGPHLDAICDHLQAVTDGRIRRLIVNIGPGHCKSLLISVFWPAWEWIDNPCLRGLYGSHDPRLAARDAVRTRDLVTSPWFRETFRPKWKLKGDQNTKSFYENDLHGLRWTFGMGGQVTGWRGDKVVVDDPLDAKHQFSASAKDHCEFVWDNKLSSRVNNPREARFVLVMQRLADDDLAGRLLKRTTPRLHDDGTPILGDDGKAVRAPLYDHLCLATEFEPGRRTTTSIGWTDWRTEPGELLFPAFFTRPVVEDLKESLGPSGFAGQYQQRPVPSDGGRFKGAWFRFWSWEDPAEGLIRMYHDNDDDGNSSLIRLEQCGVFATVDVACTEGRQNDWTVYNAWAKARTRDLLLLDESRGKWQEPESIRRALAFKKKWDAIQAFVVEATGVGRPLGQQLNEKHLAVRLVEATADKVIMSMAAAVKAENGCVYLPIGAPWVPDWLEEITLFPGGSHDDRVTGLSLAARAVQSEGGITGHATSAKPDPAKERDRERPSAAARRGLYGTGK